MHKTQFFGFINFITGKDNNLSLIEERKIRRSEAVNREDVN
jgi:hypothetical protein